MTVLVRCLGDHVEKFREIAVRGALATVLILSSTLGASGEGLLPNAPSKAVSPTCVGTFEPDRFLISTSNDAEKGGKDLVLSPEVGLSHTVRDREKPGMGDNVTHKVHAQAGGRFSLYDRFYLGFATKLPIYNYEAASGQSATGGVLPVGQGRHDYELLRLSPENLTVTGEVGCRIGKDLHLNIYYDQNRYKMPGSVRGAEEDVFGTKVIFRFK